MVVGSIGKLPYAGTTLFWLHYVVGLQELGYIVHYVENQNHPNEFYDPVSNRMTDDVGTAVANISTLDQAYGAAPEFFTLLDRAGQAYGTDREQLRSHARRADFVLDVGDPTWIDEFDECERRAFIDCDPMFTQAALTENAAFAELVDRY